jgi:hypothetical protein
MLRSIHKYKLKHNGSWFKGVHKRESDDSKKDYLCRVKRS